LPWPSFIVPIGQLAPPFHSYIRIAPTFRVPPVLRHLPYFLFRRFSPLAPTPPRSLGHTAQAPTAGVIPRTTPLTSPSTRSCCVLPSIPSSTSAPFCPLCVVPISPSRILHALPLHITSHPSASLFAPTPPCPPSSSHPAHPAHCILILSHPHLVPAIALYAYALLVTAPPDPLYPTSNSMPILVSFRFLCLPIIQYCPATPDSSQLIFAHPLHFCNLVF
ncbi:hypothetical protein C8J57DRAFT_1672419, partial [Mycena rebaudengoi]